MPFKRTGRNTYRSPSGRKYSAKQVRAYYVTEGFKRAPRKPKKPRKTR
jgi:hypothetical protein